MTDREELDGQIGPYRLLSILGEGGFGTVWLAERREPFVQRVALKVIKAGMDSRQVIARFEQERQALAVIDHPNVAKVFDAGTTEQGRPYFVMEHVAGESITTHCDRRRLTLRARLELFLPVCEAIQHAHHKGILHRDLKPSNILVAEQNGRAIPKVIDFGVAKAMSQALTDKTLFTEQGQILGTPEYMSPEQASPGLLDVDTRTDVYSLGVVLYELLTGLLPFDPQDLRRAGQMEIQRIIREVDPPTPSRRVTALEESTAGALAALRQVDRRDLRRQLHRELEWLPLMAMRKDRERRYRTPTDLADDIRNYMAGRPLLAGPESKSYLLRKFLRRYRTTVAVTASFVALLMTGTWLTWSQSESNAKLAIEESSSRRAAVEAAALADTRAKEAQRQSYVANIAAADAALHAGDLDNTARRLEVAPQSHRGFEWHWLRAQQDRAVAEFQDINTSPDWIKFAPDDRTMLVGCFLRGVLTLDVSDGRRTGHSLPRSAADDLVHTPDGIFAAGIRDNMATVWDLTSSEPLAQFPVEYRGSGSVALRPDGRVLAVATRTDGPSLHALRGELQLPQLEDPPPLVFALAWDAEGGRIAASGERQGTDGARHGTVKVWDASTGRSQLDLPLGEETKGHRVLFDHAGKHLAVVTTGAVMVFESSTTKPPMVWRTPTDSMSAAAFSPDDALLAVTVRDHSIRLFDLATDKEVGLLRGHREIVTGIAFAHRGDRLASCSRDGTVRLWSREGLEPARRFLPSKPDNPNVASALLASHGRLVLGDGTRPSIYSLSTGERLLRLPGHLGVVTALAVSPDGHTIASGASNGSIRLYDGRTGAATMTLAGHSWWVMALAFSPDGSLLVSAGQDHRAIVWELPSGRERFRISHSETLANAAFADEDTIVLGDPTGRVSIWGTTEATAPRVQLRLEATVTSMVRVPGQSMVAVGGIDGCIRLLGSDGSPPQIVWRAHPSMVTAIALSPDGSRLASAGSDGLIRIWDQTDQTDLLTIRAHDASVQALSFAPDGSLLLSSGGDGTARVWDTVPERERWYQRRALAEARTSAEALVRERRPEGTDWAPLATVLTTDPQLSPALRAAGLDAIVRLRAEEFREFGPRADAVATARLTETMYIAPALEAVRGDATLEPKIRAWAEFLLRVQADGPAELNERAWGAVAAADCSPARGQLAVAAMTKACAAMPTDVSLMDTLGTAQFRAGMFAEAVVTLTKANAQLVAAGRPASPTAYACIAIAEHRLGHTAAAAAAMAELRKLAALPRNARDDVTKSFVAEAEQELAGGK